MRYLWTFLIVTCILAPLFYALNYFGFIVTKAGITCFGASCSLPIRWDGKFAGMSGFMRRNFVVFRKYSTLAIEVDTDSGTLHFEVKAPDGSILSPAPGTYGQDASVCIDVSQFRRCSIALRMEHFKGKFCIVLQ